MRHVPVYVPDEDAHWTALAQCRDVDPDDMHPEVATAEQVEAAKAFCHGCPVLAQCRELAESQVSADGVESAYGVHAGEWWGHDPKRPSALDVLPEAELLQRVTDGWSIRKIAAQYGLTKRQVERAKQRITA